MKKVILGIVNVLSAAAIVIALFVLCTVVMTRSGEAPSILGHYVFRVMTGSMEPEIREDALILVQKTDLSEINPEDIISYYSTDPLLNGSVNTHRVVSVEQQGDSYVFATKGDANAMVDHYPALGENVLGKVIFVSYPLGVIVNFLSSPVAFVLLIIIPIFIIFVSNLVRTVSSARKILKEEEEAAVQAAVEELKRRKQEEAKDEKDVKEEKDVKDTEDIKVIEDIKDVNEVNDEESCDLQ